MTCEQIQEWFGSYWDWPADAPERRQMEAHLAECKSCAEEFRLWEESADLIREMPTDVEFADEPAAAQWVNQNVMNRIYAEQSWYMPAVRRTYAFTPGFRRLMAGIAAALLTMFAVGFWYTAIDRPAGSGKEAFGVLETANAFAASHEWSDNLLVDVPVVSLSDPIVLHVSPAMPEYWIALSMFGMVVMLLILNWLSRVRS